MMFLRSSALRRKMGTNKTDKIVKIDFLPNQLGEAVYSWLNYMSYVSESNVLAESSIRYPLAEFIERRLQRPVTLEFYHPCVHQPPSGHKRCIDFVFSKIKRENDNDKDNKILNTLDNKIGEERVYIELKYISENFKNTNEKQRVFNDLVRLALVSSKTNDCYFILCGGNEDFCQIIKGLREIKDGKIPTSTEKKTPQESIRSDYAKWLYFEKKGEKTISTDSDSVKSITGNKNYKDDFDDEYNFYTDKNNNKKRYDDPVNVPETICTKLVYIMPVNDSKIISEKMMVAIWKVRKKRKRHRNDQKAT